MADISCHHGHICVKRNFNEREITGIGNCAGHGNRRDKHAFPADERNNFVYCVFRKRKLFPVKHIRIFIEYPCIEYKTDIAIDHKVKNFGGSPMGREQS